MRDSRTKGSKSQDRPVFTQLSSAKTANKACKEKKKDRQANNQDCQDRKA